MSSALISCPDWVIINATRYAIGRMSYVVEDTADLLISILHQFPADCCEIVLRDIREEVERAERRGEWVGMKMDHEQWKRVLEYFATPLPEPPEVNP